MRLDGRNSAWLLCPLASSDITASGTHDHPNSVHLARTRQVLSFQLLEKQFNLYMTVAV